MSSGWVSEFSRITDYYSLSSVDTSELFCIVDLNRHLDGNRLPGISCFFTINACQIVPFIIFCKRLIFTASLNERFVSLCAVFAREPLRE